MGAFSSYLKKPITDKISTDESNDKLKVGVSSMQGWRITQEDAHNCLLEYDVNTALFAVYDGHGGTDVSEYCSLKLPDFIKQTQTYKDGDFENALIDGFLGFDATIPTPEVLNILQEIAKDNIPEVESDSSDVEENVSNLYEEASMPLEKVIEKYKHCLSEEHLQILSSCPNSHAESIPNSNEVGECSVSSSSSSVGCSKVETLGECDSTKKLSSVASTSDKTNEETSEVTDNEAKSNQPNQNGEVTSLSSETEKVPQENGEVKKGKGKASAKTKGVIEIKRKPKRTAQEIYKNILHEEPESESEDEEDKTFQGPNDDCSTSEEEDDDEDDEGNNGDISEEESSEEATEEFDDDDDIPEEEEHIDDSQESDSTMNDKPGYCSGCTAVVALLRGNQLYVANAGDSRCVVCRNGKAIEMSFDHKPEDAAERERVKKAGGYIQYGRVDGGLNLSRAIGDFQYKQNKELSDREQKIIAVPDVLTLTINPGEDDFMILACDGIWNSMSSQEVVDFIKPKIDKSPDKLSEICEELFDKCIAPDTSSDGTGCDNMTAIIVQFKPNLCKRAASFDDDQSENSKRAKTDDDNVSQSEVAA